MDEATASGIATATPTPVAAIGRLDAFDAEFDEWPQCEERMLCYFDANGITDESKMKPIFLSAVGARTHKLLHNLTAHAKPREKSFTDLREALSNHYNPKPSVVVQRLRFNSRIRHTGESVAEFVSALRALSEFCEYGETLNEMLRDRLVCGIDDEHTQRRLLAEKELSFARKIMASKVVDTTEEAEGTAAVHRMQPQMPKTCYRCGRSGHSSTECRFKEAKCFACKKVGNLSQVCTSKEQGKKASRIMKTQPNCKPHITWNRQRMTKKNL